MFMKKIKMRCFRDLETCIFSVNLTQKTTYLIQQDRLKWTRQPYNGDPEQQVTSCIISPSNEKTGLCIFLVTVNFPRLVLHLLGPVLPSLVLCSLLRILILLYPMSVSLFIVSLVIKCQTTFQTLFFVSGSWPLHYYEQILLPGINLLFPLLLSTVPCHTDPSSSLVTFLLPSAVPGSPPNLRDLVW